jgi:hypothetical protein
LASFLQQKAKKESDEVKQSARYSQTVGDSASKASNNMDYTPK